MIPDRVLLLFVLWLGGCAPGLFFADGGLDGDGDGVLPAEGDCDDTDPLRASGVVEICDGLDNDCDGLVDGADPQIGDADGDGSDGCSDCDDGDPRRFPGNEERCDGFDDDCDGLIDEASPSLRVPALVSTAPGGELLLWPTSSDAAPGPAEAIGGAIGDALAAGSVDIDGDGVAELIRQRFDPSDPAVDAVDLLRLRCSGGWQRTQSSGLQLSGDQRLLAVGDLDGDGFGDLVSVSFDTVSAGALFRHLGDGVGGFRSSAAGQLDGHDGAIAWSLTRAARDFDGDDVPDLVGCARATGGSACQLYHGLGDGSFAEGLDLGSFSEPVDAVAGGDFDGDGAADLVLGGSAGGDPGALFLLLGDGSGGFTDVGVVLDLEPTAGQGDGPAGGRAWLISGHFDDDDLLDLGLIWDPGVDSAERELAIAHGDGAGGFVLGAAVATTSSQADPAAMDWFAGP